MLTVVCELFKSSNAFSNGKNDKVDHYFSKASSEK